MCAELLPKAFHQNGKDISIKLAPNSETYSHLLYAGGVLVIIQANIKIASNISKIMRDYYRWTVQLINGKKCMIYFGKSVTE